MQPKADEPVRFHTDWCSEPLAKTFPFMEMPWEVKLNILSQLSARDLKPLRLVCHAVNDLVEKHRASLAPMRIKRLLFGNLWRFCAEPKRFVAWSCASFLKCLRSCSYAKVTCVVMHSITLGPRSIQLIIEGLRRNHVRISGCVISCVRLNCNVKQFVELLKSAGISNLAIIARKLPYGFKESVLKHDFMGTLSAFFIAVFDSFETRTSVAELYKDPPFTLKGAETFFTHLWRFDGIPRMHACFPIPYQNCQTELPGLCRLRCSRGNVDFGEGVHRVSLTQETRNVVVDGEERRERRLLLSSLVY
ncbi:hypothetical protein Aduo_003663 [Ancylostoma duodenale]